MCSSYICKLGCTKPVTSQLRHPAGFPNVGIPEKRMRLRIEDENLPWIEKIQYDSDEIATEIKQDISSSWMQASVHEWYEGNRRSAAFTEAGSRRVKLLLLVFAVDILGLNDM
ncbi:hypothetical protein TNCV_2487361 [Trichonephila clavipes]|uniref:Uncharacterized protein n=1 Tax=Trichonephila clavipes TaxID=2585209 RepID=A0A8X6W0I7_TRICX|nr:hypothetical protein TNCV_2487361 [Trichonephila clavipes]